MRIRAVTAAPLKRRQSSAKGVFDRKEGRVLATCGFDVLIKISFALVFLKRKLGGQGQGVMIFHESPGPGVSVGRKRVRLCQFQCSPTHPGGIYVGAYI